MATRQSQSLPLTFRLSRFFQRFLIARMFRNFIYCLRMPFFAGGAMVMKRRSAIGRLKTFTAYMMLFAVFTFVLASPSAWYVWSLASIIILWSASSRDILAAQEEMRGGAPSFWLLGAAESGIILGTVVKMVLVIVFGFQIGEFSMFSLLVVPVMIICGMIWEFFVPTDGEIREDD